MPFKSRQQMKAMYAGSLGEILRKKAPEWASKTDIQSLPERAPKKKRRKKK